MEKRIPNGTIVTENNTGRKLQIIKSVKTEKGTNFYYFVGKSEDFGLYRNEITPNGW